METKTLRHFLAIANEGTLLHAAKYLNVSQPTLSRQMKELENELGKKLFIRGNRHITLNDAGYEFKEYALSIIDLIDKAKHDITNTNSFLSGDIYLGAAETKTMEFIISIINEIQNQHPDLCFHFYSGNSEDVISKINNGLLDFGILINPKNIDSFNYIQLPYKDSCGILMNKNSPLATKDYITPEDLIDQPLILSRQDMRKNEVLEWFNIPFDHLKIKATYNLIYNASLMIAKSGGYAFMLEGLINTEGTDLVLKPMKPEINIDVVLFWKKYQPFSKASQFFLNTVIEKIKVI